MKNKKILLINWGTETSIYILRECVDLKKYDFYLACTSSVPKEIKELFGRERIIVCNPYDPIMLCEDVSKYMISKGIRFDAVTTFFEMCVYQTAFLAEYLGIRKRLPLKSALNTSVNKYLMRLELEKAGLGQPKYFKFGKNLIKEAFEFFRGMGQAAIIKPVHSGHSYGVRYLKKGISYNNFKELINDAKKDYQRSYDEWMEYENIEKMEFLLEEFIGGKIYSFDGVVNGKGEVGFIGGTEFELSTPPVMQQIGHTIPIYSLNTKEIIAGKDYMKNVVKTLNLKYCGFHGEVKYLKGRPILIEISGRLPGGIITSAYQNLSKYNIFDKFLSVFNEREQSKVLKNKEFYVSETMRIVFSDRNTGIVKHSSNGVLKEKKNFVYKIRSRGEGEKVIEKNNPFGTWLYEIVLRSKKLGSRELVAKRDGLIKKQKIELVSDKFLDINYEINKNKRNLKYFFVRIRDKLISEEKKCSKYK